MKSGEEILKILIKIYAEQEGFKLENVIVRDRRNNNEQDKFKR